MTQSDRLQEIAAILDTTRGILKQWAHQQQIDATTSIPLLAPRDIQSLTACLRDLCAAEASLAQVDGACHSYTTFADDLAYGQPPAVVTSAPESNPGE